MARIIQFNKVVKSIREHSPVDAGYLVDNVGGKKLVQIDTYGSNSREFKGKVSQSIQLDKDAAIKLVDLLKKEFNI